MKRRTWARLSLLLAVVVVALSACTGQTSPSSPTNSQSSGLIAVAVRVSCVASNCAHAPSPSRLAALAHAKTCTTWQLNTGSHGGPDQLTKLVVTISDVAKFRASAGSLPGVHSIAEIPIGQMSKTPPPDTNFDTPRPAPCG